MNKVSKTIGSIALYVILVSIILISSLQIYGKIAGYSFFHIKGISMQGTNEWSAKYKNHIKYGDAVVVKPIKNIDELKEGDIISYVSYSDFPGMVSKTSEIITHRIEKIEKGDDKKLEQTKIHTRGDANNIGEMYSVYQKDIIGKVVFIIPKTGYVNIMFMQIKNYIYKNVFVHLVTNKAIVNCIAIIAILLLTFIQIISVRKKSSKNQTRLINKTLN
ncbi:MAG: hypothetical protein N2749_02885 [Clostridia bacterium]|nr:hypothetical protein [Clostridia bacterium]